MKKIGLLLLFGVLLSVGFTVSASGSLSLDELRQKELLEQEQKCKSLVDYARDADKKLCRPSPEVQALQDLQEGYYFAYSNGITTIENMADFRADAYITRQEAAKMIVKLAQWHLGGDKLDTLRMLNVGNSCIFTDSQLFGSTLAAFVTQSCQLGFMKGDTMNGKSVFYPQGNLSKAQALAIIVRITHKRTDETVTPWYQGYLDIAKEYDEERFSDVDWSKPITRGEFALWMSRLTMTIDNYYPES